MARQLNLVFHWRHEEMFLGKSSPRLQEVAAGLEFHYVPFQFGSSRYPATAYLLAQVGVFHMNPQTYYNNAWQDLQPLATEGQGTSINSQKPYNLYQLCLPLGMGVKVSLGKMATFNILTKGKMHKHDEDGLMYSAEEMCEQRCVWHLRSQNQVWVMATSNTRSLVGTSRQQCEQLHRLG